MLDYRLRHPQWALSGAEWVVLSRNPDRFVRENPRLAQQRGVSFVAGDVRDFAFPAGRFDGIVHAATSALTTIDDAETESVIMDGTKRIVAFSEHAHCARILFTSSGAVYGPRESAARETDACMPATAYGKAKLAAEKHLIGSGLDVRIARCFAFSGPYLNRSIHFAIGNFIEDCLNNRPIVIQGDGTPLRSYLYADDLVEALFAVLARGRTARAYNIGSDYGVSIRALAETVRSVLGTRNEIVVKGKAQPGSKPSVYVPVIERARAELACDVRTSLEETIARSAR
jgi:dTDP-glucose 4,6-dehydratase